MRLALILVGLIWLGMNALILQSESKTTAPAREGRYAQTNDVFVAANDSEGTKGVLWGRAEAIKFGFEQQASLQKYLFAAAAVILTMVAKVLFEPMVKQEKDKSEFMIPTWSFWTFSLTALFALSSAIQGFFGLGKLAELSYANAWSATGPSGVYMGWQAIFLFMAILLLLVSIFWRIAGAQKI